MNDKRPCKSNRPKERAKMLDDFDHCVIKRTIHGLYSRKLIFFVAIFSVTVDGRNLIFGDKLHIGTPYRGKRFWTHQIPTSCLLILLIFIHIEHICTFFVTFFSATIDGRNLIFGHKLHIGTVGSVFEPIGFLLPVCRL